MKWLSHISIGVCVSTVLSPSNILFSAVGSIAPDVLETLMKFKHRQEGHYFAIWVIGIGLGFISENYWFSWFCVGGFLHVLGDAMTMAGVPVGWWSRHRIHLLKAPFKTGEKQEYVVVAMVIIVTLLSLKFGGSQIYVPFFYDWYKYYNEGIVDAFELKKNRLNFF